MNILRFLSDDKKEELFEALDELREEAGRLLKHYPSQYDMMYIDESFEPLERIDYERKI